MARFRTWSLPLAMMLAVMMGCGGAVQQSSLVRSPGTQPQGPGGTPAPTPPAPSPPAPAPPPPPAIPPADHVFVLVLENSAYNWVLGNPVMPFLNGLATQYGLAANYYADAHPSLPNYFMLTAGQVITHDDGYTGTVSDDNVAREITAAGKTWKVYAESLPEVGYTGGDVYPYVKHHNPFVYFSDVLDSAAQQENVVPFDQLAADMKAGTLPNYGFLVPNNLHNGHNCPAGMTICTENDKLQAADDWVRTNLGPLIADATFQNSGLLVIVFDEAPSADTTYGGGQVAAVVVGSAVKPGWQSSTLYQHENVLRLTMDALGITTLPGAGATAVQMTDFFQ